MRDISEISNQNHEKEHAVQLLLAAIRTLPEPDQDAVLALLLQGLTSNEVWEATVRRGDERRRVAVALHGAVQMRAGGLFGNERGQLPPDSEAKVVPVRFPPKLYESLKSWCEEHNFPMAAVVRGLVERFLESQDLP